MNYYYLAASLPALSISVKPSITMEEFRSAAMDNLSPSDIRALKELDSIWEIEPSDPFVVKWKEKEASLRNSLTRIRANSLQRDPAPYIREPDNYDAESERCAEEAAARNNPLEKEQLIDHCRWNALDDMAGLNEFSTSAILAYAVKLQIAQRWGQMDKESGLDAANGVISQTETSEPENKSGK